MWIYKLILLITRISPFTNNACPILDFWEVFVFFRNHWEVELRLGAVYEATVLYMFNLEFSRSSTKSNSSMRTTIDLSHYFKAIPFVIPWICISLNRLLAVRASMNYSICFRFLLFKIFCTKVINSTNWLFHRYMVNLWFSKNGHHAALLDFEFSIIHPVFDQSTIFHNLLINDT